MKIEKRYLDGSYFDHNPTWDSEDSSWKADLVANLLFRSKVPCNSIVEVGCGSGHVLKYLNNLLPYSDLFGFDISPQAATFWSQHVNIAGKQINFTLSDFHASNSTFFDVLLLLDVFEHLRDPMTFLEELHNHARFFVFHIPLDLSAQSVIRSSPLLRSRRNVGHLHCYTKELALELLHDCGFIIRSCDYTGAYLLSSHTSVLSYFVALFRKLLSFISKDFSARLLGGETLLVLAESASQHPL